MCKISVLMPTYNDASYIKDSISSIITQSYNNWELVIVDDGSTDDTAIIISSLNDYRIKYIYQNNLGQLNALNKASEFITGNIVTFLHSDDRLADNEVFSRFINYFSNEKYVDSFYSDLIVIDGKGKKRGIIKTCDVKSNIISKIILSRGSNYISDPFVARSSYYKNNIINNYII